jgi:SAM-dependent methyltransferase
MKEYLAKEKYQDSHVAEDYDKRRFSTFLGRLVDKLEKAALNKALKGVNKEALILDFPCGTGRITEFLLQEGYFVAGADISKEMMDVAVKKLQGFDKFKGFYREDGENVSISDGSFDYVTSVRLMGHLPPDARIRFLREMKRITKKRMFITFYVKGASTEISKFIQRKGRKESPSLYPESMKKAGLNIIKIIPMLRFVSECHYFVLEPKNIEDVMVSR